MLVTLACVDVVMLVVSPQHSSLNVFSSSCVALYIALSYLLISNACCVNILVVRSFFLWERISKKNVFLFLPSRNNYLHFYFSRFIRRNVSVVSSSSSPSLNRSRVHIVVAIAALIFPLKQLQRNLLSVAIIRWFGALHGKMVNISR